MKSNIKILGIGQSVPNNIVTNFDIELKTPGSNAEWIYDKLGILERRLATLNDDVVTLGVESSLEALKDANISPSDIDLIVVNTSSADKLSPSVACIIQEKLKANCPAFDINAVCSGFIYALDIVSNLLDRYKNILIISTETYSKITDWNNRNSCFFGDGSASILVTKSENSNFVSKIGADGTGWENFNCDRNSKFKMDGKSVYKFGIETLPREIEKILLENNISIDDVSYLVPHQPSHNILKKTAELLNISENKVCFNMTNYANTAGASVPMALYKLIKENKIKNGDMLILAAIGSGWTYGVGIMKLNYK
jgi:3-oxoacyl-[acyl-carrier-protein] synthase-3